LAQQPLTRSQYCDKDTYLPRVFYGEDLSMPTRVTVDFPVPSGALADFAGDLNVTGVLGVGDETGLSTGTGSELYDGSSAWPGLGLEITTRTAASAPLPLEPRRRVGRDQWARMEAPRRAATDAVAPIEPRRRVSRDEWAKVEAPKRAATDAVVPVEAVASPLRDPAISIDSPTPIEFRGTYVVSITLVLRDGRVVTFRVPTAPSD
jgi:hypothetical protein